jgi:hypothetical protein
MMHHEAARNVAIPGTAHRIVATILAIRERRRIMRVGGGIEMRVGLNRIDVEMTRRRVDARLVDHLDGPVAHPYVSDEWRPDARRL